MLSKSSKYAIRGVLYLALNSSEDKKFNPKTIAKDVSIPAAFLAKTLQQLAKKGLISSTKGRNGGFYLTEENRSNTLILIIDCIDGLKKFKNCVLGLAVCGYENPCPMHSKLAPLKETLVEELTNKSIEEFTEDIRQGKTFIFL